MGIRNTGYTLNAASITLEACTHNNTVHADTEQIDHGCHESCQEYHNNYDVVGFIRVMVHMVMLYHVLVVFNLTAYRGIFE